MITKTSAVSFRQNLGEMLNQVQYRHDSIVINKDGKPVELRRVLPRLAQRHGLSAAEIDDLVDILSIQAEGIEPAPVHDPALMDFNDQPVLGTLITARQQLPAAVCNSG